MSILVRTGTGINDVQWKDSINAGEKVFTSGKVWQQTASGGSYTCLQRTGGGINDVAYKNLSLRVPGNPETTSNMPGNDRTRSSAGIIIEYFFYYRRDGAMINDRIDMQLHGDNDTGSNYAGMNPKSTDVYYQNSGSSSYEEQCLVMSSPYVVSSSETVQGVFANTIAYGKKLTIYKDSSHWVTLKIGSVAKYKNYGVVFNISDYKMSFTNTDDFKTWKNSFEGNEGYLLKAVWSTEW